jgi:CheY-like chemotaxis protein
VVGVADTGTAAPPSVPAPTAPATAPPGQERPLTLLLAEDNKVNQLVAQRMLGQLGYRADIVGNGAEAVRAFRQRDYDVVLMDVQMPELSGLEATRELRATLPAARQPWIIAMTANVMEGDREACLAAGMNDYVSKPVRTAELERALRGVPRPAAG